MTTKLLRRMALCAGVFFKHGLCQIPRHMWCWCCARQVKAKQALYQTHTEVMSLRPDQLTFCLGPGSRPMDAGKARIPDSA